MLSRFAHGGPAMHPQLHIMAQVSGAREHGVHVPSTKKVKNRQGKWGGDGPGRPLFRRPCRISMQLRRNAVSRTRRSARARLCLALRTELPLGERIDLLQDKISLEEKADANQLALREARYGNLLVEIQCNRQTYIQTDRQTDRQTNMCSQSDRQKI